MGGLARRATVLKTWRQEHNALTVAGAYELSRPGRTVSQSSVTSFGQIFARLGYDLGALSSQEAQHLASTLSGPEDQNHLPPGWMQFSEKAQTSIITHQGLRIGFILFPEIEQTHPPQKVDYAQMQDLGKTLRSLQESSDLTIGLSPWGWKHEQGFLDSEALAPDIVLGSGSGPAVLGQLAPKGHTLWIRPYSQGRALNAITIPDPHAKAWNGGWRFADNVRTEFVVLDDTVPADIDIQDLLTSE